MLNMYDNWNVKCENPISSGHPCPHPTLLEVEVSARKSLAYCLGQFLLQTDRVLHEKMTKGT